MAILGVTGASGLIGQEFVKLARNEGHELREFSRGGEGAIPLDLHNQKVDPEPLSGCDAVIHFAARLPSGDGDVVEARECFEVNGLGTLKLMEAMELAGVTRLIQATAANAYAPWCEYPDELSPLYPLSRSFYLGSKVMQELYAHAFGAQHGIAVTSLRISSPYGPAKRSTIGRLAAALDRGESITLQNEGIFGADFIHVGDVARAVLLVQSINEDGIFNVASGCRNSMMEVAELLCEMTGARRNLVEIEPLSEGAFEGYPAINITKLQKLGFAPMQLKEGIRAMVDDLRLNAAASLRH